MSDAFTYIILILGGFIAGFINTIAGSGSLLTLPLLMIYGGLDEQVANGTNRLGILFQTFIGWRKLKSPGNQLKKQLPLIIPIVVGAIIGVLLALELDKAIFKAVLIIVMFLMLILTLFNSKSWLKKESQLRKTPLIYSSLILILAGIYGGFIQAGVGIILLSIFVTYIGYSLNEANSLKNLVVFIYTIPVFVIFVYTGKINLFYGVLLTIGQILGAYLASTFATKVKNASTITRYLLILILIAAIVKLLGFI